MIFLNLKKIKDSLTKSKKTKIIIITIICIFIIVCNSILFIKYSTALSKYGSRGEEVRTIQTKLKRWGYYSDGIDGIYGTKTMNAVKYFQRKNGFYFLPPDNPNVYPTYVHPFLRIIFRIFS